jgi:hypothetical protein
VNSAHGNKDRVLTGNVRPGDLKDQVIFPGQGIRPEMPDQLIAVNGKFPGRDLKIAVIIEHGIMPFRCSDPGNQTLIIPPANDG